MSCVFCKMDLECEELCHGAKLILVATVLL